MLMSDRAPGSWRGDGRRSGSKPRAVKTVLMLRRGKSDGFKARGTRAAAVFDGRDRRCEERGLAWRAFHRAREHGGTRGMGNRYRLLGMGNSELLAGLSELIRQSNALSAGLLAHLVELELRMLHLELGFSSLFAYCVEALGMSEGSAGRRFAAARVCRRFSEAFERVARGELHLCALCALAPHLNEANAEELFDACRGKTRRQIEAGIFRTGSARNPCSRPRSVRMGFARWPALQRAGVARVRPRETRCPIRRDRHFEHAPAMQGSASLACQKLLRGHAPGGKDCRSKSPRIRVSSAVT